MDTAAVMKNLDLVVTSDTALAHLAGSLGVPVWLALPFAPDWRWLLEREDSPWYPTMRLFRQRQVNQWEDVFNRMAADLEQTSTQTANTLTVELQSSEIVQQLVADQREIASDPSEPRRQHLLRRIDRLTGACLHTASQSPRARRLLDELWSSI